VHVLICVGIVKARTPIDMDSIKAMVDATLQSPDPEAAFGQLATSTGLAGTELPSEMALINKALDALPDDMCNVILVNYFNDLHV
jgi:hypothetical protein